MIRRLRKALWRIAAVVAALAVLAACGSGTDNPFLTDGTTSSTGTEVTASTEPAPALPAQTATVRLFTLVENDRGEIVAVMQEQLRSMGWTAVDADGIYGPGTKTAVKEFQAVAGLPVTGSADHDTQVKMAELEGEQIAPASTTTVATTTSTATTVATTTTTS